MVSWYASHTLLVCLTFSYSSHTDLMTQNLYFPFLTSSYKCNKREFIFNNVEWFILDHLCNLRFIWHYDIGPGGGGRTLKRPVRHFFILCPKNGTKKSFSTHEFQPLFLKKNCAFVKLMGVTVKFDAVITSWRHWWNTKWRLWYWARVTK